jgi:hypothetical protein
LTHSTAKKERKKKRNNIKGYLHLQMGLFFEVYAKKIKSQVLLPHTVWSEDDNVQDFFENYFLTLIRLWSKPTSL